MNTKTIKLIRRMIEQLSESQVAIDSATDKIAEKYGEQEKEEDYCMELNGQLAPMEELIIDARDFMYEEWAVEYKKLNYNN
jgi:hypothetical protein